MQTPFARRAFYILILILLSLGSVAQAEDKDGDGIDASVDTNDYLPRYQISAAGSHSCALDDSGVSCWGDNTDTRSEPPALSNPRQVDAGDTFNCALDDTGIVCWGSNDESQLEVPAGLTGVTQVSAGIAHGCALHSGGVACWGRNGDGQTNVPSLNDPVLVSAGGAHSCAIDTDGMKCWGKNDRSQAPALVGYAKSALQLVTGRSHTCILLDVGINCFGSNTDGQTSVPSVMRPIATTSPAQLAAGDYQTCALDDNGAACWGRSTWAEPLTAPPVMASASAIAAGNYQSCAIDQGEIKCWGYGILERHGAHRLHALPEVNHYSFNKSVPAAMCVLGDTEFTCWGTGSDGQMNFPVLSNPTDIQVASQNICAQDEDGVTCWGGVDYNLSAVPALAAPAQLSVAQQYACVLDGGQPVCWGTDTYGRTTPPALLNMTGLVTSDNHACAWNASSVECWGQDNKSQAGSHALANTYAMSLSYLGHSCALSDEGLTCWGDTTYQQTTTPPSVNPVAITSGNYHSCVLDDAGVQCWGRNNVGQTDVPTLQNPVAVSASYNASCAIDDTGVVCWGDVSNGLDQYPNGANPRQLKVAGKTACVVTDDGLQCWGEYAQVQAFANAAPSFSDQDGDQVPDAYDAAPLDPTVGGTLTADAGGPYSGVQGVALSIDASASSTDTAGVTLDAFAWDQNDADGINFLSPDAQGVASSVTYTSAGDYTLTVKVTDSIGRTKTATASLSIAADGDGDGTADANDDFPTQGSASQDADGDGLPDDCVTPLACSNDGLTPDPSLNDFDNDGIITAEDADDTVDTAAPTVNAAADIDIIATGELTNVDLLLNGTAYASDFPNTALTPQPNTASNAVSVELNSGRHLIDWCATDVAGNTGCATQTVDITPLVSFDLAAQTTAEGVSVEVLVSLSGNPVTYPVSVPLQYELASSSASEPEDHDASNAVVMITADDPDDDLAANVNRYLFNTVDDGVTGEIDETVVLTLVDNNGANNLDGAALGASLNLTHTVTITEANVAPIVTLTASDSISAGASNAQYEVTIDDPNNHGHYLVSWYFDGALLDSGDNLTSLNHDLTGITPGDYTLRITVIDDGNPAMQGEAEKTIRFAAPSAPEAAGDGGGGALSSALFVLLLMGLRLRAGNKKIKGEKGVS